jgi:hypothetical protein
MATAAVFRQAGEQLVPLAGKKPETDSTETVNWRWKGSCGSIRINECMNEFSSMSVHALVYIRLNKTTLSATGYVVSDIGTIRTVSWRNSLN